MGRYLIIPFAAVVIAFIGGIIPLIFGKIVYSIPEDIAWDLALVSGLGLGILFLWKTTGIQLTILPDSKDGYIRVIKYSLLASLFLIVVQLSAGYFLSYYPPQRKIIGIVDLLSILLFAPVLEELFFRGYLYVYIRENIGTGAAVCIVTLLFISGHMPASSMILTLALVLIYVYEKTGCLASSIITHMIWNTFVILPI